jgi:hypothetical protein
MPKGSRNRDHNGLTNVGETALWMNVGNSDKNGDGCYDRIEVPANPDFMDSNSIPKYLLYLL